MAKKKIIKEKKELGTIVQKQMKIIPIKWHVPDTLISNYASNVLVQILENEFKLLFFETKPQLRLSEDEPILDEARADCFSSIIVNAEKIPVIIDVLNRQYKQYKAIQEALTQKKKKGD